MGKMSLLQYRFRVSIMRIRHDHQFSFTTRSFGTYAPLPISFGLHPVFAAFDIRFWTG